MPKSERYVASFEIFHSAQQADNLWMINRMASPRMNLALRDSYCKGAYNQIQLILLWPSCIQKIFRWLGIETIYYNGLFYFMKRVVVTVHDAVISSMLQNNYALKRKRLPFQIHMNK